MSDRKRRRAVVLRDFSYTERPGEKELAIERFLHATPEHIDISVQPPEFNQAEEFIRDADIIISFGIKSYPDQVFDWLLAHPRHVHVSQDWWEPVQPQSKWRDKIVEQAAAVIFMSPLHRERYERIYQIKPRDPHIVPFPMLESDWMRSARVDLEPEEAVLWCAGWHPDYGNDIMLRWADHMETRVHAHGLAVPTGEITPMVEGRGLIALDVAALSFLPYSKFIFFPRAVIPFGFTFMLAYMLGLEVTYSGEIGCLSYVPIETIGSTKRGGLADYCNNAPKEFWQVIEEVAA